MSTPSTSLRPRLLSFGTVALILGLLAGCDAFPRLNDDTSSPPAPYALTAADSTTIDPGIKVSLRTPDTVALGDPFRVQIRTDNQQDDTVRIVTGTPALYDFGVHDGSDPLPLKGTNTLITQVETEQDVPPTELVREPQLRAARFSDKEAPISPGSYTNRLVLNWTIDGGRARDTLETTMVFRNE